MFNAVRGKPLPAWAADIDATSWGQIFLKYVLAHPAVTAAIPATGKLHHLEDNLAGARGRLPDAKLKAEIVRVLTSMKSRYESKQRVLRSSSPPCRRLARR